MSTTISPNSAEQVDTSQAATDPGGPQKASQRREEYMPLTFPSLWSASEVPQGIQPEPSMAGAGLDQVVVPGETKANSSAPKHTRVISEKRSSDSSTSSVPLRRSGFLARRSGPATPPLHQLILANGALGTISILSSPATTTTGVSPRSSSSVESLMEDGTEARSSTSTLIDLLIEENKDLFMENQAVREEMEAREEALTRTKAEHESSQQRLADLEKQLDKKQKKHEITRRKLHWTRNQWASAEFISGMFSNGFKQQRSLADSRAKTVEDLATKNEELQARLVTLTQERDAVTEERNALQATQAASAELVSELKSQVETLERKTAMLVDRNASLALHVDELEIRNEELGSTLEGMAARNEELCDTIRRLREREEELELLLDEATRECNEMSAVYSELEYAYNELRSSRSAAGSALGERDDDRASVTSEDMDLAGLEEAANAVGEDGEYLDAESADKHRTPSKSYHSRSRSYDRPPSSISDVDTSDPVAVATQIKRLERLIEEYHDSIERLRAERIKLSDRAVELEAFEDDLRQRLDNFTELEIDLRNRENDYFATCEAREKEFLELSDEYERWRLDCEVREVDVEQERIDVWRFRKEVEKRLERIVKREELVRKREGEVRWRMLCLDGALGDAEGCWQCVKAPAELFPPTPPVDFSHLDEEYRLIDEEEDRRRAEAAVIAANAGGEASHEEDIDERYLREEIDIPFEFDGREAVQRYLAEQEQHERDRRDDEYINLDEEANQLREEAEVYDEIVNKRVAELIRKADEKRREVKERKERRECEESRRDEIAGQYDDEVANLNVDGLHGLGFVPHPDSYPDRYIEEPPVPTSAFTFTAGSSLSGSTSLSTDEPSTSSSTNEHHLVDSSAMRVNFADRLKERQTQREAEEGMSSSWEEVPNDQA